MALVKSDTQLFDLIDDIMQCIMDKLPGAVLKANQSGRLEELLQMLDMQDLLDSDEVLETYKTGRIVVIGYFDAKPKDLYGVAKNIGIEKERLELADLDSTHAFDYHALEYNPKVCAIMFGPIDHKTKGTGDSSSAIANCEKHRDRFATVYRLSANNALKITKTSFRNALEQGIDDGVIAAA